MMKDSALVNGGKGTKRTRNGIPKGIARSLFGSKARKQNTSDGEILADLIGKYNDFQIAKECCIIEQIFNLQFIVGELEKHNILLPEKYQIGMLIAKLPSSLRRFATTEWHCDEEMCMDDLVALIIEENERMQNDKTVRQKMKSEETDIRACWACRKVGCGNDSCRRPKNAIQKVEKMIVNKEAASPETPKNFKVKNEHRIVQGLPKEKQNDSTPTPEVRKRAATNSCSGLGACWSCRKMGYMTDICTRRSNKVETGLPQNKRHRSEVIHNKKISKLVLRSCLTCRKKSYLAVCQQCQKNIINGLNCRMCKTITTS